MESNGKSYLEQPHFHTKAPYRHPNLTYPANATQALRDAQADPNNVLIGVASGIPSVFVAKLMAATKPDFIWIDMEHAMYNRLELQDAIHAVQHHSEGKTLVIVRVPKNDETILVTALDSGAAGIVFPHIESVEEIKEKIKQVYYPPLGCRGFSPWTFTPGITDASLYPDDNFNMKSSNRHVFVTAQIESVKGIENVDEIAAVEGVGALMFGPGDFSADAGIQFRLGEPPHPDFLAAMGKFSAAAKKHNKPLLSAAMSLDQIPTLIQGGAAMICVVFDSWGLQNLVHGALKGAREIVEKEFSSDEKKEEATNGTTDGTKAADSK